MRSESEGRLGELHARLMPASGGDAARDPVMCFARLGWILTHDQLQKPDRAGLRTAVLLLPAYGFSSHSEQGQGGWRGSRESETDC